MVLLFRYLKLFLSFYQNNSAGLLCDECKSGYFYLTSNNPEGCTNCVCMGITANCSSTTRYRKQVIIKQTKIKQLTGKPIMNYLLTLCQLVLLLYAYQGGYFRNFTLLCEMNNNYFSLSQNEVGLGVWSLGSAEESQNLIDLAQISMMVRNSLVINNCSEISPL